MLDSPEQDPLHGLCPKKRSYAEVLLGLAYVNGGASRGKSIPYSELKAAFLALPEHDAVTPDAVSRVFNKLVDRRLMHAVRQQDKSLHCSLTHLGEIYAAALKTQGHYAPENTGTGGTAEFVEMILSRHDRTQPRDR